MSAVDTTLAVSDAMSLSRFPSLPPPTTAVFVTVADAACATATFSVNDGSLELTASASARPQLTVCPATEHVHPAPVALVAVRPSGRVSLSVTTPDVAPRRLTFETGIVKVAAEPRVKLPTWLLLRVKSGAQSAADCIPVTCDSVAEIEFVPVVPGVAP